MHSGRSLGLATAMGLCAVVFGCDLCTDHPGWDGGLSDHPGADRAQPDTALFEWSISNAFDESMLGGAPVAFAVGPGGRMAFGFFRDQANGQQYTCTTNLGSGPWVDRELHVARFDGTAWSTDFVELVKSTDAVAGTYGADGNFYLVYMSGPSTGTYCGVSQLFYRVVTDSSLGTATLLVNGSGSGDTCRLQQNACNAGDNAGRYPAITFLPDGRSLVAYSDTHFNFAQETDIEGADLEILIGQGAPSSGGRLCLDDSSGSGNFNAVTAGQDGRPAIATWVRISHNYSSQGCPDDAPATGSYSWPKGIYLWRETPSGTWAHQQLGDVDIGQKLALAYTATDGYVIAYKRGAALAAYQSSDGVTFTHTIVDQRGNTGTSPAAAIDGQG
ncbi:MAG: hypothetical protein JXR83_08510, partial [Deltaproteobacteria bacterium]|nr:hypothetical protein [Deltaproteobacteria bacterium]